MSGYAHIVDFLASEDEAQMTGYVFCPDGDVVHVQTIYRHEEYMQPAKAMTLEAARELYRKCVNDADFSVRPLNPVNSKRVWSAVVLHGLNVPNAI